MSVYVEQDFEMFSGDDFDIVVTVRDTAGVAKNLTGTTAVVWNLAKRAGGTALLSKTLGSGVVLTTPLSGVLTITLAPADTAGLAGPYYHEVQLVDAAAKKMTVLRGTATLLKDQIQ